MSNEDKPIPIKLKDSAKQLYVTGAFGGFTPYDFRLVFYNEKVIPKDDLTGLDVARESDLELIMTPRAAKELKNWLSLRIDEYEKIRGEIDLEDKKDQKA